MYTIEQKTKDALFNLLTSVDFDLKRIVIADHEFYVDNITMLLEDSANIAESFDKCVKLEVSLKEFATMIQRKGHNSYYTFQTQESGLSKKIDVEISEPIKYYINDASRYHKQVIREELLEEVLNELIASIVHG